MSAFIPTSAVEGAWSTEEQHIAPALGLIAHAIDIDIRILRPGRTIELVEAVLSHDGRPAVIAMPSRGGP